MMYFYELFSHPDRFLYRAHLVSNATFAFILCTVLTFLSPFLLTYYTGDFWIKESVYSEQPRLTDQIEYLLLVKNNDATNNQFLMSSSSTIKTNFPARIIQGSERISSSDIDGDGLLDQFRVSFNLSFTNSAAATQISSINLWLIFPFELRAKQRITMKTMALINIVPPYSIAVSSSKNITVYGQLKFEQNIPIRSSGNDSTYNQSILNIDSSLSSLPDFDSILDRYFTRNFYTTYENQYTWVTTRTPTETNVITIGAVVNVGRQAIRYQPGFWQDFKWGWIQYISVLLPFLYVFNRLKLFVFSNHLVRTLEPLSPHRHKA